MLMVDDRQTEAKVVGVAQLNNFITKLLDSNLSLQSFLIKGEISGHKFYSGSGHHYFTLKDDKAQVSCVLFAASAAKLAFRLEDGQQVICRARASFYARDGRFQLYISAVKLDGTGDLYAAYAALKEKLEKAGLFAAAHKRDLPLLPDKRVAVITSPSGAVIRDIIQVGRSRNPNLDILLFPVFVQGDMAAQQMVEALNKVNARDDISVVIIGRGGGSMEDLWCFNDEALAYAVYNCKVPVVSAVGHETDFTICDFVADKRASTPSNAAEMVFLEKSAYDDYLSTLLQRCRRAVSKHLELKSLQFQRCRDNRRLREAYLLTDERYELLDRLKQRLTGALQAPLFKARAELIKLRQTAKHAFLNNANHAENKYNNLYTRLSAGNPLLNLKRGYAYVSDGSARKIESAADLQVGEQVNLRFWDGDVDCKVEKVTEAPLIMPESAAKVITSPGEIYRSDKRSDI